MTIVCMIPGPSWERATAPDDRPTRWCFHCRTHLPHSWSLMDDPPERQPSYYEPVPVLRCSRCRRDRADFPGTYRDGPRYPSEAVWHELVRGAFDEGEHRTVACPKCGEPPGARCLPMTEAEMVQDPWPTHPERQRAARLAFDEGEER